MAQRPPTEIASRVAVLVEEHLAGIDELRADQGRRDHGARVKHMQRIDAGGEPGLPCLLTDDAASA